MRIIEVTGIDGRKHNVDLDAIGKEFAKDGERLSVPLLMMDASREMFFCDTDQLKGINMSTVSDEKVTDADRAYKEMCDELDFRNKTRGKPGESADDAYAQAAKDLQDAWKRGPNG